MSTPRTDEAAEPYNGDYYLDGCVSADFARQLERELEEANANYKLAHSELGAHVLLLGAHKSALEKARETIEDAITVIGAIGPSSCGYGAKIRFTNTLTAINEVLI